MKWWMLCDERLRINKAVRYNPPPSEQHSTRPPAFQSPLSIFQLGMPNCHLRGSQIHVFCFSLLIPLSVFLTSVETNIFHIYDYIYIYAYIYIYIYEETERHFLDSSRPPLILNTSFYKSVFLSYVYLFYFVYIILFMSYRRLSRSLYTEYNLSTYLYSSPCESTV
jgi:hypothetical protein